jgi:hypothetical protein
MAQALVIDADPSDIRALASALELQNRNSVNRVIDHNRRVAAAKRKESERVLEHATEIGAEYIRDASTRTKTTKLEDYMTHYHPNE